MDFGEVITEVITSNNNPLVKRLAKLNDPKYRKSEGLFLCEGVKLAAEALDYASVKYLLVSHDSREDHREIVHLAKEKDVQVVFLAPSPFSKISTEKSPQGVIAVVSDLRITEGISLDSGHIFLAHGVRDPGNLGTIIRTAGAFGFDTVIMSDCADIGNHKTLRASMGGIFRVGLVVTEDMGAMISGLLESGRRVFACALTPDSVSLDSFSPKESDVFIVGNEGHGLPGEIISACTDSVIIDMFRNTESLNVASASTVVMWEHSKSFRSLYGRKGVSNNG